MAFENFPTLPTTHRMRLRIKIRNSYRERRAPEQVVEGLRAWFQTEGDTNWRDKALLEVEKLYRQFETEAVEKAPPLIDILEVKRRKKSEEPAIQIQKSYIALLLERLAGKKERDLTTLPKKWKENLVGNKRQMGDNSPIAISSAILGMSLEDVEREALQRTSMKEFANNLLVDICARASKQGRKVKPSQALIEGGSITAEDLVGSLLNQF